MSESFKITDGMYGTMEIEPVLHAIIHTPEFQRLHYLKQLGITYRVFPGATHTRAVHSIGVCYLAHAMASSLGATDVDLLCVDIAALCHDLGHGPLSHKFDIYVKDVGYSEWTHENQSVIMLKNILNRLVGADVWKTAGLNCNVDFDKNSDVQFICSLICGQRTTRWRSSECMWMYDIINNERTGIDVDKIDYILRDTSMTFGTPAPFDLAKILRGASVSEDKREIHYNIDGAAELLRMSQHRFVLFDQLYTHPKVLALSLAIIDGLDHIEMPPWGEIMDPDTYMNMTDTWIEEHLRAGTNIMDNVDADAIPKLEEIESEHTVEQTDDVALSTNGNTIRFRIDPGICTMNPFGCLPVPKYKTFLRQST